MGIFARKRETGAGAAVQLREGGRHPFGVLDGYVPLSQGEMELYRSIREAVPIVDAALRKLVRLAGGVKVSCRESAAQEGLDWFLQHVNTGRGQWGFQSFLDGYLDSMLTFGRAVGVIVPYRRGREIAAVLCGQTDAKACRAAAPEHADWLDLLVKKYGTALSPAQAQDAVKREIGAKFETCLEHAGVFKLTPDGLAAFDRFLAALGCEKL